jgi:hypothetical protein
LSEKLFITPIFQSYQANFENWPRSSWVRYLAFHAFTVFVGFNIMVASNLTNIIPDAIASNPQAHPAHANPQARDSLVIIEKPQSLGMTPYVVEVDEESLEKGRAAAIVNPDRPIPTEEESHILRRVAGPLPWITFVLCVVEFAERGSYYAAQQVFANFMNFPLPPSRFLFGSSKVNSLVNIVCRRKWSRCGGER